MKGSFGLSVVRSAMVEWSLNLGETCLQILDGRFVTMGQTDGVSGLSEGKIVEQILVLTERSLFLIKDTGAVMQQRRLEKEPSYVLAYQGSVGQGHNFVLANRDLTLQVFVDFQLVWAVTVLIELLRYVIYSRCNLFLFKSELGNSVVIGVCS